MSELTEERVREIIKEEIVKHELSIPVIVSKPPVTKPNRKKRKGNSREFD